MIVTITFILFISGLIFFAATSLISRNAKWKKERIFRQLSKEGAANNLTFCSQEMLQDKVMGFDGLHRKIMILEKNKGSYHSSIISLDEVQHCELVTADGAFDPVTCKNFSRKIRSGALELKFQFTNPQQSASISFSNELINSKRELALLAAKAEYWCIMFSKMLSTQMTVRA
jgi:hypothetical protein